MFFSGQFAGTGPPWSSKVIQQKSTSWIPTWNATPGVKNSDSFTCWSLRFLICIILYLEFLLLKFCKLLILEDCKCCFFEDWQLAIEKKTWKPLRHFFWQSHFSGVWDWLPGWQLDGKSQVTFSDTTCPMVCQVGWRNGSLILIPCKSCVSSSNFMAQNGTSGFESNATDREMYQFKQRVSNWQCLQFPVTWTSSKLDLREKQRYKPFMMQCFIMMLKIIWRFKSGTQCPLKREPHVNINQISNAANLKKKIKPYLQIQCSHS